MTIPVPELPERGPRRIVLVSEDDELRSACARALREHGCEVQAHEHSGHALLTCLEGAPIDVLIADLASGEGSGPALARRMRRFQPELRAIYLARPGTVCDAEAVLVRPFTRDDLLDRLSTIPARVAPADPRP